MASAARQSSLAEPQRRSSELALGEGGRVWEGIVTTVNADGSTNIAPMGPIAGESFDGLLLRPFATSRTYANLAERRCGVFHLVDDVELLARAAIDSWQDSPELTAVPRFQAPRLAACARWFAFEVEQFGTESPRADVVVRTVDRGVVAEMAGLNRAKAAVVEAAILATRVAILPADELRAELRRLEIPVQKTGAAQELRAMSLLRRYVEQSLEDANPTLGAVEGDATR